MDQQSVDLEIANRRGGVVTGEIRAEPNVDRKNLLSLFDFDRVDLGVVLNRDKL